MAKTQPRKEKIAVEEGKYVRTSVKIRSDLWRKAKLASMDNIDLAAVVNEALEAYFEKGGPR